MGLFRPCESCAQWDKLYRALQLEVSDLRDSLIRREEAWTQERKSLIERVLVVEHPAKGLALVGSKAQSVAVPVRNVAARPVMNLPGHAPDLRPPMKDTQKK